MKQRDKMRELLQRHRGNEEQTIQAYADAEERGEVPRNSDLRGLTARDYAARLFADGIAKGWIHEPPPAA